jgi:hypothetical protein
VNAYVKSVILEIHKMYKKYAKRMNGAFWIEMRIIQMLY